MRISFCTTCMGRLSHLAQTLPQNLKVAADPARYEFVVLNYNSPDDLESWAESTLTPYVESGLVSYYRTDEPVRFVMPHAKNVAHKVAAGEIVCNLDADNFITPAFVRFLERAFEEPHDRVAVSFDARGLGSRIALRKTHFLELGGYCERFSHGWGYEDSDLIVRLHRSGFKRITSLNSWLFGAVIEHEDALRTKYSGELSKQQSSVLNLEVLKDNIKAGVLAANMGQPWGEARLSKNFTGEVLKL